MKKQYTMKTAYLVSLLVILVMLFLQVIILFVNSSQEAKNTTHAYLVQAETIIEKNKQEDDTLLASLKEEYTVLAKAVSYYLDHNPEAIDDAEELRKICTLLSIDEIYIFDDTGTITSSTIPEHIGLTMDSGRQISYFKPMLTDRSLTMCQDITPNTAEGKPMVYAMTWNEDKTYMVQVGIEPVRLLKELESNEIQATVEDIALNEHMSIIVADDRSLEVVGSKNPDYIGKSLTKVTSLTEETVGNDFSSAVTLSGKPGFYFCSSGFTDEYCVCVFLSHEYFFGRILESLLVVAAYLLAAFFVLMRFIRRLISSRQENDQHMQIFQSLSEIYYSLHLVDLKKNTTFEYSSRNEVKDSFEHHGEIGADVIMRKIMEVTMSDEYLQQGLEFADMSTVAERMRNKKIISRELLGKNVGWIRMSFITFEAEDGLPVKIIVATQIIDEEKKLAESLYEKSHMDELTGCHNRRAYNTDIQEFEDSSVDRDFVYISLDVNGLKTVNDDLGHDAGDELISGASDCMKHAFSRHGKVYRLGGDEFVAIVSADSELIKMLCDDFDKRIAEWHGELVQNISVSYGYVLSSEVTDKTMSEVANLADKRMYESKANYYRQKGIDRRRT